MDIIKVTKGTEKGKDGMGVLLRGNLGDLEHGVSLAIKDIICCAYDSFKCDDGMDAKAEVKRIYERITAFSTILIEEQLGFCVIEGDDEEEQPTEDSEESGEDHGKDSGDESELNFGVAVLTKEELFQLLDSLAPTSGKKKGDK